MADVKIVVAAQDNASRVLAGVRNNLSELERTAAAVGSALGVIGVGGVAGLAALARNAINGLDALNDLADATGASVENISALEDVAARTGTSFDTVGTALVKFNAQLKDAKPGSGAEQALKALGLSVKELKDLDPAEALLKTSIALGGFADDANKARIVQELFGKSIKDVAPLLKDLAEKGKLVATATTEQAKAAEDFNKELFALGKNATDAARSLTIDLVTGINKAAKALRDSGLYAGLQTLLTGDDQFKNNKALVEQTEALFTAEAQLQRLRAGGNSVAVKRTEDYIAKVKEQLQVTQNYRKVLEDTNKPLEAPKPSVQVADTEASKKIEKDREKAQKEFMDRVKRDQEERIKLGRQFAIEQGDQVQAEIEALQKSEDAQTKKTEAYLEGLVKELRAFEDSNQKQREQLEEIGLTKEELNALTLARLDNTIATEQATLAIANAMGTSYEEISALEQKIGLLKEQRELTAQGQVRQAQADTKADQEKASKEYADTLRTDLKGAFSAAFRDSQDPLRAFGDALENVIFTRASTALAESLAEAAAQEFASSAGSGGIGSFLSSLLSFDGGGSTGSGSRTGGLDGKGGFMAMLHPQESVIDHTMGQTGSSGGTVVINQTVNIDSRSDQATILAAMSQAKDLAKAEILRSRQRGGSFA